MSRLTRLLQELHRRSVWQVLVVYAGFGYGTLQAADLVIDRLGFPSWLFLGTLIVLAAGFPVILLTALLQHTPGNAAAGKGTPRAVTQRRARALFTWPNAALGGVLAFALLGAASVAERGVRMLRGDAGEGWARGTGLLELNRLIEDAKWDSAWSVARRIERAIPGDSTFEAMRPLFARRIAFRSDPPGARVFRRFFDASDTTWEYLGQTPLPPAWFPNGVSQVRIEKEGFEAIRRTLRGWEVRDLAVALDRRGSLPVGMLRVPGGEFGVQSPGMGHIPSLSLGDYLIDRFEVSNREYKRFVQANGYQRREFWAEPFTRDGRTLSWEEATHLFVDRTGRPGPATWEAGDYPAGEDDLPVGGLSWYEAAAYARFAGKSLPSIFHWNRAAGTALSAHIVKASNFGGRGALPVGRSGSLSPFGAYDMGGNVREWCFNEANGSRYILGGGWNDEPYLFTDVFTQSPWDRSPTNGLRLVKYLDPRNLDVASRPLAHAHRDFLTERPVSDDVFALYRRQFAYDPRPLNARVEEVDSSSADFVRTRVSFDAAYGGERVVAFLFLPRHRPPPYQAVVYFPGSNAIYARSTQDLRRELHFAAYDFIVKSGRAVILPMYKGTFERGDELKSELPEETNFYKEHVIAWGKDFARTLDYLGSRPDVDTSRVAYYGLSWGGAMGAIIPAVEPRIRAVVLYVAGLNMQRALPEVDAINYVGRVRQPTLMLNGRYDHFFPVESSLMPMFKLLGTPAAHKRQVIVDGGHFVPRPLLIRETLDWLDRYLGPVQTAPPDR